MKSFLVVALLGLYCAPPSDAQIGVSSCNCQPSSYIFAFDFSLGCEDNEIVQGSGISDESCIVNAVNGSLVPVTIVDVQVQEFANGEVVRNERIAGTFVEGDEFRYLAFISTNTSDVTNNLNPSAIQFTTTARNAQGEGVVGILRANFDNDCETFPVIENNTNALWMTLVNLGSPFPDFCPFAGLTHAPSLAPITSQVTDRPTTAPVSAAPVTSAPSTASPVAITRAPVATTADPSASPITDTSAPVETDSPVTATTVPSASPLTNTGAPIETNSPVAATDTPVASPTTAPTTDMPVRLPTSPSKAPSPAPVISPTTRAPVTSPTPAPVGTGPEPEPSTPAPVVPVVTGSPIFMVPKQPPTGDGKRNPALKDGKRQSLSVKQSSGKKATKALKERSQKADKSPKSKKKSRKAQKTLTTQKQAAKSEKSKLKKAEKSASKKAAKYEAVAPSDSTLQISGASGKRKNATD